jgi:hypothetical protein
VGREGLHALWEESLRKPMRTIFHLVDITDKKLLDNIYMGEDDEPPEKAKTEAQQQANETGHEFMLTRGKYFFKKKD